MEEVVPPSAKKPCLEEPVLKTPDEKITNDSAEAPQDLDGISWKKRFGVRRKFAVLLSYSGKGYVGMQKNPGVPTIEEDLLAALCKANAFPKEMENDLGKLYFQRCARTDKGVSAARQLVSLKMVKLDDAAALINAHLPPQIRVMAVRRVTRSFDSRHACNARMYEYLLPTYASAPFHQTTADHRISDETVTTLKRLLEKFVGTRNYHNFTSGKKFDDMSARRFIMLFEVGSKFMGAHSTDPSLKQLEFITLRVKGQSFVLHQIRKMVGFVLAIMRGRFKEEDFEKAFEEEKVDIPKAPSLGLLLNYVYFDHYNAKYASDGERESLDWSDLEEEVEDFKRKYIYRTIIETELKDMAMMQWLHTLQLHDFHNTAARLKTTAASASEDQTNSGDPLPDSASSQSCHKNTSEVDTICSPTHCADSKS